MKLNSKKGFTLIEMLVVVAIIGLLSSVIIIGLGGSRAKARDAKRISDLRQIQSALEIAYVTGYPAQASAGPIAPSPSLADGTPTKDPKGVDYQYVSAGGESYTVGICTELALPAGVASASCDGLTFTCSDDGVKLCFSSQ